MHTEEFRQLLVYLRARLHRTALRAAGSLRLHAVSKWRRVRVAGGYVQVHLCCGVCGPLVCRGHCGVQGGPLSARQLFQHARIVQVSSLLVYVLPSTAWQGSLICRLPLRTKHVRPVRNVSCLAHVIVQWSPLVGVKFVTSQKSHFCTAVARCNTTEHNSMNCTSAQCISHWSASVNGHKHVTFRLPPAQPLQAFLASRQVCVKFYVTPYSLVVRRLRTFACVLNSALKMEAADFSKPFPSTKLYDGT